MTGWKNYEDETAEFYRSLGLDTRTGEQLVGSRGTHKIDVTVRGLKAGIRFLWIVECKHWRRRVSKEKVAALSAIAQDVGADRGILLSESGFQSGAPRMAQNSNITLTSLSELRLDTESERREYQTSTVRKRCEILQTEVDAIWSNPGWPSDEKEFHFSCPRSQHYWHAQINVIEESAKQAVGGFWPVRIYIVDFDGDGRSAQACDYPGFIELIDHALGVMEDSVSRLRGERPPCWCKPEL
ncbi:restriction endonuclease [Nocardia sp. R7R-8]|uniref:restriction endonuclease n=1 Tax=Nocardia sp. R7R-8 TaxID=3459304 RepID=UPI00403E12A3